MSALSCLPAPRLVIGGLLLALLLALAPPLGAPPARAQSGTCTWSGTWSADGFGNVMTLTQSGNQVTGTYDFRGGRIAGTVSGSTLNGTWTQDNARGDIQFVMAANCNSFSSRWRYANETSWHTQRDATRTSGSSATGNPPPSTGVTSAAQGCSWGGTWADEGFGDSMSLTQSGNQVTGTYNYRGGRITGTLSGSTLNGTWTQDNGGGDVQFVMAANCNSFTVRWRYANESNWHTERDATRKSGPPATGNPPPASNPPPANNPPPSNPPGNPPSNPPSASSAALGGMDLAGYCQSYGIFDGASVLDDGNWYCVVTNTLGTGYDVSVSIDDMSDVCRWQYNRNDAYAQQRTAGNAFSWLCYGGTAGTPSSPPPGGSGPRPPGGSTGPSGSSGSGGTPPGSGGTPPSGSSGTPPSSGPGSAGPSSPPGAPQIPPRIVPPDSDDPDPTLF